MSDIYPRTLDGRYLVVRGRLWRLANPALSPDVHDELVHELMASRRAVRNAKGDAAAVAGARVDAAKKGLVNAAPFGGTTVRQITTEKWL